MSKRHKFRFQLAAALAFDYLTIGLAAACGWIHAPIWLFVFMPLYALAFACGLVFFLFVLGYLVLVVRALCISQPEKTKTNG
jgi:hypothetical protein